MMKNTALKILATIVIAFALNTASSAQTEERIKFARGKSAATVSGVLSGGEQRTFNLYVKKGQKITMSVRSANGKVEVDAANFSAGQFEEPGNKSLSLTVDQTGDYQVYIRNPATAATRFTLTVAVR